MKIENRKTVYDDLKKYIHDADEHGYVEVTEWTNGMGYDIDINSKKFSLSCEELEMIVYLTKVLDYEDI